MSQQKDLDDLIKDIYSVIEKLSDNENIIIPEDLIEDFGERIKSALVHWCTPKKQSKGLRMSNLGRPARQLWYEANRKEEGTKLKASTHIKFLYGHLLEELILLLVKLSGHTVTEEQKEVEVDSIKGHIDCKINGEVVDIKTSSNFGFKKFKEGTLYNDDPFGYMHQLSAYEEAEGTEEGGFLAINKETGELAFFRPGYLTKPNIKDRIDNLKIEISSDSPPERCYKPVAEGKKGNLKLATGCVYCAFKKECWSDANNGRGLRAFRYANGARYLTRVASIPNVPEILI